MRFFVLVFALTAFLSSCGNDQAYQEEVKNLQSELALMQEQMLALQTEKADEAKTALDATGIAIVDLEELLKEYKGYQASLKQVEAVINRYGKELEKMQADYNQMYQVILKDKQTFGDEYDETEDVASLQKLERDALLKEQEYTKKSKELNDAVMSKELQKINAHSKKYAEENGYQLILFTSVENGIFYANDKINITDAYIANINAAYEAGK